MGPPPPNDHPAWSPPPGPSPGRAPHRRPPSRPAGTGEHLLRPGLPHPAGTWPWTSPVSARRPRRRCSRDAGQTLAPGDHRPGGRRARPTAAPFASPQSRCRQVTTRPRPPGTPRPTAPSRAVPTPSPSRSSATRTARRHCRGQRGPVRPDTWTPDAWTPDAWTPDVRSTGWTDVPRRDRTRRTGQPPTWPASGHPRADDHPPGGPDLTQVTALGALGHPGRLRGDGTCAGGP